jgi:phage gp29-like protein
MNNQNVLPINMKEEETVRHELVAAGNDILNKYGSFGENPDKIIASKGMDYLSDLEKDTHLGSQLALRRQKLVKKGFRIVPQEKNGKATARSIEMADFVKAQLRDMQGSFLKDVEAALDAVSKGFSITEINYRIIKKGKWKGKTGLESLRFKPAKYFSFKFDKYGHYTLRQIDPDMNGKDLPLNKFLHLIAGHDDENPYGDGVTTKAAFWVWLKKNEAKFWAIFSERFGMPQGKIELPANAGDPEKQAAENIINNVQTSAGIIVPKGFVYELLEAKRTGDAAYDNFIERCNKEISKIVLGATLTTEEGKRGQGSYALGHEHAGILEDYIIFDAAMTAEAINEQLIRRLIDINYETDDYPRFEWIGVNIDSFISFAQGIGILADRGIDIPVSWVRHETGIPEARENEPVLKGVAAGNNNMPNAGIDNRKNAIRKLKN